MLLRERLRPRRNRGVRTVHVRVKGGYQPSVLHAHVGEPLRIVFAREETAACSEHVVFPAFGKSAMLPPFEEVALELVPEHAGEYEFTCQLGMLRGRLVVEDTGNGARSRPQRVTRSPAIPMRATHRGRRGAMHYCAMLLMGILIVLLALVVLLA
ncbi:MAG TPA: cupredoxin domain-containing protein [Gaiellaceae bacterium]|nr:cupredoxin domain-containing protein [Gaiellaceae bacterium]